MSITYYARVDYNYNGGDKKFSIPFDYIKQEHIIIIINDTEQINNFEFLTNNQIQVNADLTSGDTVSIRRVTPLNSKMVTFTDDNILDEESQNLAIGQVFNAMQEVEDRQSYTELHVTETMSTALSDIEASEVTLVTNVNNYVVQQLYNATGSLSAACYTKSEADVEFATKVEVSTLNTAYTSTLDTINIALDEILEGSTTPSLNYENVFKQIMPDLTQPAIAISSGTVISKNGWLI